MGPLATPDGSNTQPSPVHNPIPFHISLGVLSQPIQLWRHTAWTSRVSHDFPQEYSNKKLVGFPWHIWLECRCSPPELPFPHHCVQGHQRSPSFGHSGILTPPPYPTIYYTVWPYCPRHDQSHMFLMLCPYHCLWQSTGRDPSSPPGHSAMVPPEYDLIDTGSAGSTDNS